jgi:tetratricopeptide (TPR) repeat protein
VFVFTGLLFAIASFGSVGCASFGRRGPSSVEAAASRELTRQGEVAMQHGQWQEAESLMRQALEASPDDPKVRRQLAEALWNRSSTNEAMSHIAAAVRLDPKNAEYLVRAGEMALAAGAKESALAQADRAIRIDPQLASAWALRGRTFRQLNEPERALADMQHALVFEPERADLLFELATMYRERGQSMRCLTTLHHLHETYADGAEPQSLLLLEGQALLELKRPQQAAEVLLTAANRETPNVELLYQLAQAQSDCGNVQEAAANAQRALALDGAHQPSRALLAQLASQTPAAERQLR